MAGENIEGSGTGVNNNSNVAKDESKKDEAKPEEKSSISLEEAKELRKGLDEIYKKIKAENDRTEKMLAENLLEGKGTIARKEKYVETDKDYARKVLRGEL